MKNLSDFTGEEAIELWAELYDQFEEILTDKDVIAATTGGKVDIREATRLILRNHRNALLDIFDKLDAEINGANLFTRTIMLVTEMIFGGKASTFFGSSRPESSDGDASGDATAPTPEGET